MPYYIHADSVLTFFEDWRHHDQGSAPRLRRWRPQSCWASNEGELIILSCTYACCYNIICHREIISLYCRISKSAVFVSLIANRTSFRAFSQCTISPLKWMLQRQATSSRRCQCNQSTARPICDCPLAFICVGQSQSFLIRLRINRNANTIGHVLEWVVPKTNDHITRHFLSTPLITPTWTFMCWDYRSGRELYFDCCLDSFHIISRSKDLCLRFPVGWRFLSSQMASQLTVLNIRMLYFLFVSVFEGALNYCFLQV